MGNIKEITIDGVEYIVTPKNTSAPGTNYKIGDYVCIKPKYFDLYQSNYQIIFLYKVVGFDKDFTEVMSTNNAKLLKYPTHHLELPDEKKITVTNFI